jgi:RNA polymerase sigma-70 factor, ECF subfamily
LAKPNLRLVALSSMPPARPAGDRGPLAEDRHALVSALKGGDEAAAAAFFREFEPLVARTIGRILGYDDELGDATQEAFLRAVRSLRSLRDPQALVDWLIQISVCTATDFLRRRRRRRWLTFVGRGSFDEPAAEGIDEVGREAVRAAYRVLDRMRPEDRTVFALRFIGGMDVDTLANAHDCSRSTIKRRLAHAAARFRVLARREAVLAIWVATSGGTTGGTDDDEDQS